MLEYKARQHLCITACQIFTHICEYFTKTAYSN